MSVQSGGGSALNSDELYDQSSSLIAAAHELKAPLVVIRQLALLLQDESPLEISKKQELLGKIRLTSERSLRLVEALTRSTRLDDSEFFPEPVQITRLCEDVAHELSPLSRAMQKDIELKLPTQPVLAYANYGLLRSIAVGLCDNALSHGGASSKVVLSVNNLKLQNSLRLSVRDNGPKLEKTVLHSLKSRLGKSPQPLSRSPASSGLGLYIASQFAEAIDSKLGMISHRSQGTTFYIEIPVVRQLSLF